MLAETATTDLSKERNPSGFAAVSYTHLDVYKRQREYYPNGKLKTVVRNSIVQEKYDEQGRPIDERPGFETVSYTHLELFAVLV